MGKLTDAMRQLLDEQHLGFVATVNVDGSPNLAPKGTTRVWDRDHIIFADLGAPDTVAGLRRNPGMEICVLDSGSRTGWRFKGLAIVLSEGALFEQLRATYGGAAPRFPHIVLMTVVEASPLEPPAHAPPGA
ncbi:MAG TPA: pyridoxamine 5'-phosphate oxidase family protein [Phenylobacterium sp.]